MPLRANFFKEMEKQPLVPADYDLRIFPFMRRHPWLKYESESYVRVPPALVIQDKTSAIWTLGFDEGEWRVGDYPYDIVRNGTKTGEFGSVIEYRKGILRIYSKADGWRVWLYRAKRFL